MSKRSREQLEYRLRRQGQRGVCGPVFDIGSNDAIVQLAPTEDAYEAQLHLRTPVGRVTFSGREVRATDRDDFAAGALESMVAEKVEQECSRLRGEMLVAILNSNFTLPTNDEVSLQVVERVSIQLMEVVDRARKEPGR